ncbi:MAG TPA: NAD-dependent epimerase/dehydratase family protein [Solirubrobacterales bacterium]|nr:NAD-dependent epimerase/dehydratase family protein [Solirubrobacterales bacterium]
MRALVTGGAGFVGSHLVDHLLTAGSEVLVIDDFSTGRRENTAAWGEAVRVVDGDIRDAGLLDGEIGTFRPDRAFHLAAQADVRKAIADPAFDASVNVLGTINLLEAIRGLPDGCPVVFASTGGAIYGEGAGKRLPLDESADLAPETAYGASKLTGEIYLSYYRRLYGMSAAALRFGNVYGPRQDPHGEAGVVAIFCGRLLEGRAPTVFGNGRQTRDYVYVSDVVDAIVAAGERLTAEGRDLEGPFNVGTGIEGSVLDLIEGLAAVSGRGVEPEFAPARTGEVERISIDPAAAADGLGWSPRIGLEEGLRQTWAAFAEASEAVES